MPKKRLSNYVCGFAFNNTQYMEAVLLVKKLRPKKQAGLYNGIGGHIEPQESPEQAMVREFEEETGSHTDVKRWELFCVLDCGAYKEGKVYFFGQHFPILHYSQTTDEKLILLDSSPITLRHVGVMPNLHWLLPMYLAGRKGAYLENNWPFYIKEPE